MAPMHVTFTEQKDVFRIKLDADTGAISLCVGDECEDWPTPEPKEELSSPFVIL